MALDINKKSKDCILNSVKYSLCLNDNFVLQRCISSIYIEGAKRKSTS